jgi:hypothetical protein
MKANSNKKSSLSLEKKSSFFPEKSSRKKHFLQLSLNVSQILKPIFNKRKDNFLVINNLNKNWQKIVGDRCWQFCIPKKVRFQKGKKNNATLYIVAYNSAIAFYLEANSTQIIQNIASYYGYKIISQIRISQELRNVEQKELILNKKIDEEQRKIIEDSTINIKDDGLKLALQNLGKSIFGKNVN